MGLPDGDHDIYLGGATPIRVTCVDGWVELKLQPTPHSDNAWIASYMDSNGFNKCGCAANSITGLTSPTGVSTVSYNSEKCELYHTFTYTSGGRTLTDEELIRLSQSSGHTSYDRDFDVISVSCDDDDQDYPRGLWMAFETSINSGVEGSTDGWRPYDCTTGNNVCCEENSLDTTAMWDTYPMPHKVCASINTGGGVAMVFVERNGDAPKTTLKIRPSDNEFCNKITFSSKRLFP